MQAHAERIVGREAELERLRAALARARGGRSAVLCVLGPPGQGKTALLDRLAEERGDAQVVRATGVEAESEVPFGALDALLRPLLGRLGLVPAAQRRALEAALALTDHDAVDPLAIGAGTLSLLAAAAEERPLLCLVDDLQWVDEASRRALLFAARRLDREAVAVVLAARVEDEPPVDVRGLDVLRVGPLDDAACAALVRRLGDGRTPDELVRQLVGASGGNPLTLLELATRLTPAQLDGREPLIGPPPPGASARSLLAQRVAALPDRGRRALLVVATSEDADLALLGRALGSGGLEVDDLVDAEDAGLLALRDGRVALRHPLVRSVAYHEAGARDRREAHAAVAAALPPSDGRRAWHLAAASTGPDEAIAAALEVEAERVRLRGGHRSSGRVRVRAAQMTPDPAQRVERLLEAAHDFELGGLFADAERALRDAGALTDDPPSLARIRGVEASLTLRRGRPREAREALVAQARALAPTRPRSAARFFLQAGFASMALIEVEPWLDHTRSGLALVPPEDPATRLVGSAQLAAALVAATRLDEAEPLLAELERTLLERGEDDPVGGAVEVYALLARTLIWLERWELAARILERLERDARRLSAVAGLSYVLYVRTLLDAHLGRWANAEAALAEQSALARDAGEDLFSSAAGSLRCWLAALRGRREECEEAARETLAAATDRSLAVAVAHYGLGLLALGRGEVGRAVAEFDEVAARAWMPEPGWRVWEPDHVEALIRAGELGRAEERLRAWEADARRSGRVYALATAARCRAMLAPDEEVDAAFEHALALHDGLPMPLLRGRVLLCLGERLRRARRRADARTPLRQALAVFEELGAGDWAARARTELRAAGGMAPARARRELEALTPHEIQVARLVAEGRTNREVAAALFLAPKTIEHHLSTIFRKLDVKRRTELARVFAGEPVPVG